jgi:hypothetical protein
LARFAFTAWSWPGRVLVLPSASDTAALAVSRLLLIETRALEMKNR